MRLRVLLLIVAALLLAVFVAVNWSVFVAPTTLSLLVGSVEAPLGLVMLGVLLAASLAFTVYMVVWQGATLLETRRHAKEMHEQRALADQAEASRFTELRGVVHAESERLVAQLAAAQEAMLRDLREQSNSLAASLGEIDDRLRRGASLPPAA